MRVLFIESRVNNPVRLNIALPMTYLALYSFIKEKRPDIEFYYHSLEIDFACNSILSLETIPGETIKSLKDKADFIIEHCSYPKIIPLLSFITPHRGTNLFHDTSKLGIKIIDNNLDHYNHLFPVCFPETLGESGISILKQAYNDISVKTRSESFNPLLEV